MARRMPIQFPTTQWSLLEEAGKGESGIRQRALSELLSLYLEPIRAFVAAHPSIQASQVDDIVQDFLSVKWLEQNLIAKAEPEKGRFRSFLLTVLENFMRNRLRSERRSGKRQVSHDALEQAADPGPGPETMFDQAWARKVVYEAVERMKAECSATGRADLWGVFEARVLNPQLGEAPAVGYAELIEKFGFKSPVQASNALMTAKRSFLRALRGVIAEYEGAESSIDEELQDLRRILSFGERL